MDSSSNVEFLFKELDGKTYLVYHRPQKYCPQPGKNILYSSSKPTSDEPFLLCPTARRISTTHNEIRTSMLQIKESHEFNEDFDVMRRSFLDEGVYDISSHPITHNYGKRSSDTDCEACNFEQLGGSYLCHICGKQFHQVCVESPLKIKHPYHPQHSLQLFFLLKKPNFRIECLCCGTKTKEMVYHCTICELVMHPTCAFEPISSIIDQPKRHPHPLTLFPRQTSLTCNVCGLLKPLYPTFVCLKCNFVAHKDCMHFPTVIKISRHVHRVSFTSSLPYGEWSCGVCRRKIDGEYGAYTCNKCGEYAVHPRCALRKDICDGKELEGVPEEDDITLDPPPFETISDGVILHFLHQHNLHLGVIVLYDENKCCHICSLPIYEGDFYSCKECDFIIHKECANARRRIQHGLNPLPLTLVPIVYDYTSITQCDACHCTFGGFAYEGYKKKGKYFTFDVRCASVSEPFDYQGHEHPLYLALEPGETPTCHVCRLECRKQLNCIICDFIVCFKCATLPYKARYKHDKHFLTVLSGKEVCEKDWCEVCERNLGDTDTKVFYGCNEYCGTTLHVECLLGKEYYMRPGQSITFYHRQEFKIFPKSYVTRPFCIQCKSRCEDTIYKGGESIICSWICCKEFSR